MTKERIPEELQEIPRIDSQHPYKYLRVEMDDVMNEVECVRRMKKEVEERIEEMKETNDSLLKHDYKNEH